MTRSEFNVAHGHLAGVANCLQCKYMYHVSSGISYCQTIENMLGIEDNPTEDARVHNDFVCDLFIYWRS
jgi:hypothetical protein